MKKRPQARRASVNHKASLAALLAIAALVARASAAPPGAAAPMTPAQALDYRRIGDLHFSPDGSRLAFVVLSYPQDYSPHVWLIEIATGSARELTPAGKSERSPEWSPDGRGLAVLSNRGGGKAQVLLLSPDGAAPVQLTTRKYGVTAFRWSPDGRSIAYLAQDDEAADEDRGPQIADDERALPRLWVIDVTSRSSHRLGGAGEARDRIDELEWQDGTHLLAVATDAPRVEEFNTAVYQISTRDGRFTPVSHPPQPFNGLTISADGAHYAVRSSRAHGPLERDLFIGTVGRDDLHAAAGLPDLAVADLKWHEPDVLWVCLGEGFYRRLYRYSPGAAPVAIGLPLSVGAFDVARDGRIAFAGEDFAHLQEIYLREADGRVLQLSHLQPQASGIRLAPTAIFHTRSFDGTPIEAALMQPQTPPAAGKRPLVLLVHGGPASSFAAGYGWETAWGQLLASHGYQVLLVNPRGSNGYSEAFLEANRGDWGGGDYRDLMAVLDAVIARGQTDSGRLGIGGWSYGGEMSEWAITQTRRFKAAVAGAGVFDQAAEFETEHNPAGDEWYFGTPWEQPRVFARNSPSTYIRNARTPTLVLDGEDDRSNPVGQSRGLYRALKHFGVETELVVYPGEGHSPRSWSSNLDMFTRILDWYDRYLNAERSSVRPACATPARSGRSCRPSAPGS
jgi:dipeptidyl aminopeptidase/acylaminoacyl peptidase